VLTLDVFQISLAAMVCISIIRILSKAEFNLYLVVANILPYREKGPIHYLRPQVFYNGSLIIPDDGRVFLPRKEISETSARFLIALQILGILAILTSLSLVTKYRTSAAVRKKSFISICVSLFGSLLFFITSVIINRTPNSAKCITQIWTFGLGFTLLHNGILIREFLLYNVFKETNAFKKRTVCQLYAIPILIFGMFLFLECVSYDLVRHYCGCYI
jgi:hypothetical protein